MLSEARERHAAYVKASYTVRTAYSRAADREARRIKRLEQEERVAQERRAREAVSTVNDAMGLSLLGISLGWRRHR